MNFKILLIFKEVSCASVDEQETNTANVQNECLALLKLKWRLASFDFKSLMCNRHSM
jgi:hypothetical protein